MASVFMTKPLDAHRGKQDAMPRVLGRVDVLALGIGAIVGTGIFVLSGTVAATHTGPAILAAFLLAGLAAMLAGLCYAEIACMVPAAGSAYTYAYASLGEIWAWIIGWDLLLEYLLAAASVSVGWSAYVVSFVQHVTGCTLSARLTGAPFAWDAARGGFVRTGAWINLPAVFIVSVLTTVLVLGVRESARFNALTVFIKIAVILLFIGTAAPSVDVQNWVPFLPDNSGHFGAFGWSGLLQGSAILFFCYNGFDAVCAASQEVRRPERDLPWGILGSLVVAALLYVGVAAVLTGVAPYADLGVPHPVSVGIARSGLPWLAPWVEIGAIAGLTSVILVNLLSQPRIAYAMAQDGLLPQRLGRLHQRFKTPYVGTLCAGVACAAGGGLLPIDVLGELMCVGTLFAFALVSIGVVMLRVRAPHAPRRFRVVGPAWGIPLLSVLACGGLLAVSQIHTLLWFAAWLFLGLMIYAAYGFRNSRLRDGHRWQHKQV